MEKIDQRNLFIVALENHSKIKRKKISRYKKFKIRKR